MGVLIVLVPLACWLLASSDPRIRLRVSIILLMIAAAQLLSYFVLSEWEATAISVLLTAEIITLIVGMKADPVVWHESVRLGLGRLITCGCCLLLALFLMVYALGGATTT
ncbi:hypothetical protein [Nocardia crassostreae]|uniref:hypothetical protein n=1 Tax=Nocardia crassostreae TaxID=53428 RepID=UPI00083718B2|nr:hypothetical protein [Nocardia crassostreae]